MCAKFEAYWENVKRVFGRSRTIFLNVVGVAGTVFVEMSDYLTSFNWDDFFKHEVAAAIGLALAVVNIFMRTITVQPVNFSSNPNPVIPSAPVAPVAPVSEVQSPKAE
jgi:hypothetical protein